jgi:hypothetical protein
MWGLWGNRAREQVNESINYLRNALNESFVNHNISLRIPDPRGGKGDQGSRDQLEENPLLEDSRGNVIPPIGSRETTREQLSPSTTRNSEPDPTRSPWEDPEIQGIPIPIKHKTLVDSLQAAVDDAAWVINSNTGAKMSGEAFEQFKSQADVISRTLGTLSIGAPVQAAPELRTYLKYADAVRRKLASLVVQLRNDVHNQTIASERLREAAIRHGLAKDRTSSPVRHREHAARPAELGLQHYMKRLSPNQCPSLASLKDPENLRLVGGG